MLKVSFTRVYYLLFKCAPNSFWFLPAHSLDHRISVGLNGNLLIICLCRLPNTYKDYPGLEMLYISQLNKRIQFHEMSRREELCAYVIFSEKHTQKRRWQPTVRETARDGRLSQPFGSGLSQSAHYCHQAEDLIWAMSRLISAPLKASLWEKLWASSPREDWIKTSSGAERARSHLRCLGANNGRQWRVGGPKNKTKTERWLVTPVSLEKTPVTQALLTVLCTMQMFMHIGDLFYLADGQQFYTLNFQMMHSSKWNKK